MPWLSRVEIAKHFKAPDFAVDLTPDPGFDFTHLVFTGPNGSGKTTILGGVERILTRLIDGRDASWGGPFSVNLGWVPPDHGEINRAWQRKEFVGVALSMQRNLPMEPVKGPSVMSVDGAKPTTELANKFLAYLVNQQVQARLARDDDPKASAAIFAWFADLERALGDLFDIPGLRIEFRRESYDIQFVEPSGLSYGFAELPSGYASVLRILAELVLRVDALGLRASETLSGVVLIDEIDAFLHPALQERVLPFLVRTYPRLQFVVATHSPAVATSVRNARVVALGTGASYRADALAGTPYGQLLTTLFGIETDVDLETTRLLHELQELWKKQSRTPAQQVRLVELAESLQKTDNPLALEIWLQLQLQAAS